MEIVLIVVFFGLLCWSLCAVTPTGQRQILTIKHTLGNYPENAGVTGISQENRNTGAVEKHSTQSAIARNL